MENRPQGQEWKRETSERWARGRGEVLPVAPRAGRGGAVLGAFPSWLCWWADVGCERTSVKNNRVVKDVLRKQLALTEVGKAFG